MSSVGSFSNARQAKEFLAEHIVSQAKCDGVALSEVERKMLFFSDTDWTLPDMTTVSQEFDRDYDQAEYERKIAGIVRNVRQELTKDESAQLRWNDAVAYLRNEDHYLLVLIDGADADRARPGRPPGDFLKLIFTAILVICIAFAAMWFFSRDR